MKKERKASGRKMILLTCVFYIALGLAEAASKVLAVLGEFTSSKITSTLTSKLGEGANLIVLEILRYALTLVLIYVLFAFLNGHYALLATDWINRRWPKSSRYAQRIALLAVNATFLVGVYGLNAALYPASDLAFFKGVLGLGKNAGALKIAAITLLAIYVLGFIILNIRYARKPALVASLLVWAGLLIAPLDPVYLVRKTFPGKDHPRNTGPNVVMIGLDSLNPLHAGYSGYPLPLTPNLDSFLRENVVFKNCYTPIARTFPAWYSILTGQYPVTNGVRLNLMKRKYIKSADQCLGNILRKKGYASAHFTDEVRFSNITSEEGFDRLRHPPMGVKDFLLGSFHDFSLTNVFFNNPLGYLIFPFLDVNRGVAHLYDGQYFINDLISSLDRLRKSERFFLAAHLCIAHWPYVHASPRVFQHRPGADPAMSLYDSSVRAVDEQLGRILGALKAKGLYDDSIIIVLSDHGESAEGHGSDLRDSEQNRTLLAWKPAGPTPHRTVDRLVRTIDIAPTVLDLLGQDVQSEKYDGASLKPWIFGTEGSGPRDADSVIMETEFSLDTPGGVGLALQSMVAQGVKFYELDRNGLITVRDDYHDVLIRRRNRAILTPDWKLVYEVLIRGGKESTQVALFDVRKDPLCGKDVSAEQPAVFQDLWDRLRRYYGSELMRR